MKFQKHRKAVIALAQMRYFDIKTKHNVDKIVKYIHMAKRRKADIVCFPEACISKSDVLDLNGSALERIKEACKNNEIWCIVTDDFEVRGVVHNVSVLIDRKGEIRAGYKKIHLYGDKKADPGRNTIVVKTDFAKIGIVICWDLTYPELFERMKKAGAEIIFCPSQWWYETKAHESNHKEREVKILESLLLTRAYDYTYFVGLCNPVMESKYQVSYSAIASPSKILKKIIKREGLITAKINLGYILKQQKIYFGNSKKFS